ncbi:MAG TPA: PAS domain S-box protein [Gemmatimonadales bacterium]|nr:PAS domain S-box protein [Gemmatimonadales bacterium]
MPKRKSPPKRPSKPRARTPSPAEEPLLDDRFLFRAAPVPAWVFDLDTMRFLEVNDAAVARYGWSRDEFLALSLTDIRPPDDVQRFLDAHVQTGVETSPRPFEAAGTWRHRTKDGRILHVRISWTPVTYHGRPAHLIFAHDITAQREVEAALADSEARFHGLFDRLPIGVFRSRLDGQVLDANPAMARILGFPDAEAVTRVRGHDVYVHPEERDQLVARARKDGEGVGEVRLRRQDGKLIWARVSLAIVTGHPTEGSLVEGTLEDITERREAEQELRASRDLLRTVVNHAPVVVWSIDRDGVMTLSEGRGLIDMGLTPGQLVGQSVFALFGESRLRHAGGEVSSGADAIRRVLDGETVIGDSVEGAVHFENIFVPMRSPDGAVQGAIGIAIVVSEQRRLEEQLRHARRLESIGRLAGGVAHDFNNLLTVVQGALGAVRAAVPPAHPGQADVEEIAAAARRATDLTRQLLAFGRRQFLTPEVIDVRHRIEEMRRMLERLIGEDIALRTRFAPEIWPIRVDPGQFDQVLMNLAVNARDAMPGGGTLMIGAENFVADDAYAATHADVAPGPHVVITVTDTGVGIPPEVQPHIFEPFFTTKPVGEGSGLGLSTVYGIVRQSGGTIWVYSEPGHGTTFKLYFPRWTGEAPLTAPLPRTDTPRGAETILLVEDEPAIRRLMDRALRALGYRVLTAAEPKEALARLAEAGSVDLLVSDVVMPGMGGRELADLIRRDRPTLRVLFISGYTADVVFQQGGDRTREGFLAKPFTPADLATRVRELLDATPPS